MCSSDLKTKDDVINIFESFHYQTKVQIFEAAFDMIVQDLSTTKTKIILDYMKKYYYIISNVDVIRRLGYRLIKRIKKGKKNMEKFEKGMVFFDMNVKNIDKLKHALNVKKLDKASQELSINIINEIMVDVIVRRIIDIDKDIDIKYIDKEKILDFLGFKGDTNFNNELQSLDTYAIHVLGDEPSVTGFKTAIKATGNTKYYDVGWRMLPEYVEPEYIEEIRDIEQLDIKEKFKNNPYGYFGAEDSAMNLQIFKEKGKGMVCTSYSKSALTKIIKHIKSM